MTPVDLWPKLVFKNYICSIQWGGEKLTEHILACPSAKKYSLIIRERCLSALSALHSRISGRFNALLGFLWLFKLNLHQKRLDSHVVVRKNTGRCCKTGIPSKMGGWCPRRHPGCDTALHLCGFLSCVITEGVSPVTERPLLDKDGHCRAHWRRPGQGVRLVSMECSHYVPPPRFTYTEISPRMLSSAGECSFTGHS